MRFILKILLVGVAVLLLSHLVPGVAVSNLGTALVVALVLALLNVIIRPLLILLTIPITLITLGLFLLVINALIILLADALVPGFEVAGFITALLFSLLLSLVSWLLDKILA